jgi:hypothetical protein
VVKEQIVANDERSTAGKLVARMVDEAHALIEERLAGFARSASVT